MKKIVVCALKVCLVFTIGFVLIIYLVKLPGSSAYFTDRVESEPVTINFN